MNGPRTRFWQNFGSKTNVYMINMMTEEILTVYNYLVHVDFLLIVLKKCIILLHL